MTATRTPALVVAAALGLLVLGASYSRAASPPLLLALNPGNVLEVVASGSTHIRTTTAPGTVIASGSYQVTLTNLVGDADDNVAHVFRLSGPGMNFQSDLVGGDEPTESHLMTLAANATYTFEDLRNPQFGRVVFTTSSAVTSSEGGSSGGSSGSLSGTAGNTSSGTAKNKTVVGSNIVVARGTLSGDVGTTGKLTLARNGKSVSSLKSGRYKIVVLDESGRRGFFLQKLGRAAVKLTGAAYIGRHTVTMTLKPGQWMFYATTGRKSYFVVTG
jgi:hypothetical protein